MTADKHERSVCVFAQVGRLALFAVALNLAGCAGTPAVIVQCPAIATYDQEFQAAYADQLEEINPATGHFVIPEGSPVDIALIEWERLRAEIRACWG